MVSRVSHHLYHRKATVELGGDFDAGEKVLCERIGNRVTLTAESASQGHTSLSNPASAAGVIPAEFRPVSPDAGAASNLYAMGSAGIREALCLQTGTVQMEYRDFTGSTFADTATRSLWSITYSVSDGF